MKKYILAGISITLVLTIVFGCTGKTNTLNGTIFVSGNEPFTYLALKGENDTYYKLECDDTLKKELWSMQGTSVKIEYADLKESDKETIITVTKLLKN